MKCENKNENKEKRKNNTKFKTIIKSYGIVVVGDKPATEEKSKTNKNKNKINKNKNKNSTRVNYVEGSKSEQLVKSETSAVKCDHLTLINASAVQSEPDGAMCASAVKGEYSLSSQDCHINRKEENSSKIHCGGGEKMG